VTRSFHALVLLLTAQSVSANPMLLDVCYNFGCNEKASFILAEKDLDLLRGIFTRPASAEDERVNIGQAIAWMERFAGRQLPTRNDVARNYRQGMAESGQMDCIDESTNTTGYLAFLQQQGLLRWHEVVERAFRAPLLLDQHWAAQIRERNSKRRYVVDSWINANGEPPLIQPLEDWLSKRLPSK
jgi:hypothetical protein